MQFKLGNSTIRYIFDINNLNIISIISYFDIFPFFLYYYHYTIYDIILISIHHTVGPFMLYFSCHSQYNCCSKYSYNCGYLSFSFNSITYFANNTGKHRVFVIYIHTCKFTILILRILRFGLSHRYIYTRYLFLFF